MQRSSAKFAGKPLAEFRVIGEHKIGLLRELETNELLEHEGGAEEVRLSDGRKAKFSVLVEKFEDQVVQVVVQGFLPAHFLPFLKHVFVAGFQKDASGNTRETRSDELYGYD